MLFTSLEFFLFVPLCLALAAAAGARWRGPVLLLASWGFYGAFDAKYLVFLGGITVVSLLALWAMDRWAAVAGWWLGVGLVLVLGSLFAFKFYDFLAGEVSASLGVALPRLGFSAPAGYSFYAFMAASLLIDRWRGVIAPGTSAQDAALFLAWFPKILAGPIERAQPFLTQIRNPLTLEPALYVLAFQLILWGLFKKVVIADNLAPVVDNAYSIAAYATPMDLLIATYFFAFQIYCDFSGYADMAIGISLLFGIRLMENFRRPYLSATTAEFWSSRWHISLGHWFRDYLYFPLGGSRAGALRTYFNVMMVFVISGLWHAGLGYGVGWGFLVWGVLNGAYQWGGLAWRPLWGALGVALPAVGRNAGWHVVRVVFTFHLILLSWVFFRADGVETAWTVLGKIGGALPGLPQLARSYPFSADHALGAALIVLLVVVEIFQERRTFAARFAAWPRVARWGTYYLGIFALLFLGRWQGQEFIYMQF